MKKMKKIIATLLAMVMVIAMAVPAFAGINFVSATPSTSTADVAVEGLAPETEKVDAYKFLSVTEDADKVLTYELADWAETAVEDWVKADTAGSTSRRDDVMKLKDGSTTEYEVDVDKVITKLGGAVGKTNGQNDYESNDEVTENCTATNELLAAITAAARTGNLNADETVSRPSETTKKWGATFTGMKVGSYIVIATDATNVYNPMQISVGLTSDNNGAFNGVKANGTNAKYTTVPFTKEITDVDTDTNPDNGNEEGNDYQVGDTVNYKLTMTIPYYDLNTYKDIEYSIVDTMSVGLDPCEANEVTIAVTDTKEQISPVQSSSNQEEYVVATYPVTVKNGTTGRDEQEYKDYVVVNTDKNTISIDLSYLANQSAYIGETITITYSAKLNAEAETGFDPNTNTAVLTYTNDPDPNVKKKTKEDETKTYTFAIDGDILGNTKTIGQELKKTGQDEWKQSSTDPIESEYAALAGAEFTLYSNKACTDGYKIATTALGKNAVKDEKETAVNPATSAADGRITFTGLKGDTTYYLKETKAKDGYSINDHVYAIRFVPTINDEGVMTSYSVYIDDMDNAVVTYTQNGITEGKVTSIGTTYATKTVDEKTLEVKTTEIRNTKLASLPSTGGIGTTIFTIAGCVIMIAAGGMLIVSRRKKNA